ncbi:MAG: MarR family transcriptional regulator [Candidatus Firestonebacteria bacterium]
MGYNPNEVINKLMEITYELNFKMNLRLNPKCVELHDKVANFGFGPLHMATVAIILRENQAPMLSTLADKLSVSYATMTNLIDKLEESRFIERRKDISDRRAIRVGITDEGRKFLEGVKNHHLEGLKKYFSLLSRQDRDEMLEAFDKIYRIVIKNRSVK